VQTKERAIDKFREQAAAIEQRDEQVKLANAQSERLGAALAEAERVAAAERERADTLFDEASGLQTEVAHLRATHKATLARGNRRDHAAPAPETAVAEAAASGHGGTAPASAATSEGVRSSSATAAVTAVTATVAGTASAAAVAPASGGGLSEEELRYLRSSLVALLTAPDLSDEELWSPLAVRCTEHARCSHATACWCRGAILQHTTARVG
jgi:hypothetical protein